MKNNFEKALVKLLPFSPKYLGVDVALLIEGIESARKKISENGERFETLCPKIHFLNQ